MGIVLILIRNSYVDQEICFTTLQDQENMLFLLITFPVEDKEFHYHTTPTPNRPLDNGHFKQGMDFLYIYLSKLCCTSLSVETKEKKIYALYT